MLADMLSRHGTSEIEGIGMEISEAKNFKNQQVDLTWKDRLSNVTSDTAYVFDVTFVPLYGPCMLSSVGDISLDRITDCQLHVDLQQAA
jgi:hypothetical protein